MPAKPGSLNSEEVIDKDAAFAQKFLTGERWTEFANQPKWIIEITLKNGLTGIGETYRSASKEQLSEAMQTLVGQDVLQLIGYNAYNGIVGRFGNFQWCSA